VSALTTSDPALVGAVLGLVAGLGLWLVLWRIRARRLTLDDRLAPYLRARPSTSRLLAEPATHTPFPTLERLVAPVLDDAGRLFEKLGSSSVSIRRRLALSGSPMTVEQFRAEQVVWSIAGLAIGLLLAVTVGAARGFSLLPLVLLVSIATLSGAIARDQMLSRAVRAREERMIAEFPAIAELLALAVGAGEGPVSALERVATSTTGELSAELLRTLADARSGTPLARALERMADRTSLPSIVRFTEGVSVAVERGTPLAEVLRAQAHDAREVGRRQLMETGGRKEVLMMVPVVFLILPVTVLFAIFPGIAVLQVGL